MHLKCGLAFRLAAFAYATLFAVTLTHAQSLVGVQSRKTHTGAGTFDLPVNTSQGVGGSVTVDPRAIGPGHIVVFQFDVPVSSLASAAALDSIGAPIGTATSSFAGSEVTVTLTGIPDNTRVTVQLTGVNGALNVSASIGFLNGDVNNTRSVNASDISAVKSRSGQSTTASNFMFDVNASGTISATDILAVKARSGLTLPDAGQGSLLVNVSGTGTGSVSSMPTGVTCPSACTINLALNSPITLTATPGALSTFAGWTGACSGATSSTSITLTSNMTCTATFSLNSYAVTPSSGSNGSISPATAQQVSHGATTAFNVTPNAGFAAIVSGTCGGALSGGVYTTNAIVGACTVVVSFVPIFTVTPSASANGSISPSTPQSLAQGATTTFTVTPNANHTASVTGTCGGSLTGNTFTTNPVNSSCTVDATFVRTTFQVTPTAGSNGSISPSTVQTVNSGTSVVFIVTPSAGYAAVVGGTCGGTLVGNTYTTNPVTGLCAVTATFVANTAKYVSTTGNDSTGDGTISKPWKTIGKGIATMAGGDTLIVRNGVYTGTANFITGVKNGTASRYTVIMAESPMDVRIQSTTQLSYYGNMLSLDGNYIKVDGFIFDMAGTVYPEYNGFIGGNYNKIMRSIFKRSGDIDQYGGLLFIEGNDNLIEDVAGVGACRYCFAQGGPSSATQRTIWRRLVGRIDYSNSNQPKATFNSYGNDNTTEMRDHLYQNVIAIDGQRPGNFGGEEKYGGFYTPKRATNVRIFGSIVLNEAVGYYGMFLREFNSVNAANHSVIWNLPGSLSFAGSLKADNASNMTIGGTIPGGAAPDTISPVTGSLINPAVKPANLLNNTPGAVILKRWGVSGTRWGETGYDQLTSEDLWPWPYQDKIKSVFREANPPPSGNSPATNDTLRGFAASGTGLYGGPITLTSYIWEFLGTPCPASACP
jgi:Divergent InlB B-repeat domain/Dockerin type I domain